MDEFNKISGYESNVQKATNATKSQFFEIDEPLTQQNKKKKREDTNE